METLLKYLFPGIDRGDLFEIINNIRKIRRQIPPRYDLEKEYKQLLKKIIPPAKSTHELLEKYREENTRADRQAI
jgi:hypothetical protein